MSRQTRVLCFRHNLPAMGHCFYRSLNLSALSVQQKLPQTPTGDALVNWDVRQALKAVPNGESTWWVTITVREWLFLLLWLCVGLWQTFSTPPQHMFSYSGTVISYSIALPPPQMQGSVTDHLMRFLHSYWNVTMCKPSVKMLRILTRAQFWKSQTRKGIKLHIIWEWPMEETHMNLSNLWN